MITCSIIIVNYKAAQLVIDCLDSIFREPGSADLEVIVVDNFSQDDSETVIRARFPEIEWLQMAYNSGFARANNAGIRIAKSDIVLLLNSDTLNENNCINECIARFRMSDHVACGVQLLNHDRTPQISGSFFMRGGLNQLLLLPVIGPVVRLLGNALKTKKPSLFEVNSMADVDWVNGAFLMCKRSAAEKAGLLDEDFFLFFEEIEWCSRLRKVGRLCIYGDLRMIHLMGATADKVFETNQKGYNYLFDRKGLQIMVSAILRIRKQYGIIWFLFHLALYLTAIPLFLIPAIIGSILQNRSGYTVREFAGYVSNCMTIVSLSRRIILNTPYFYKVL